jgi:hypothetical protein
MHGWFKSDMVGLREKNWKIMTGRRYMDIGAPEAAEILNRNIDANTKALKELTRIVKILKDEIHHLKERVEKLEKS